jgi:hypothetical protein
MDRQPDSPLRFRSMINPEVSDTVGHVDDQPLTADELAAIRERVDAATPGPWESFVEGRDHTSGADFIRTGGFRDDCPDIYVQHESRPAPPNDLDFIAHARQDIPRLLGEVERLRRELAE